MEDETEEVRQQQVSILGHSEVRVGIDGGFRSTLLALRIVRIAEPGMGYCSGLLYFRFLKLSYVGTRSRPWVSITSFLMRSHMSGYIAMKYVTNVRRQAVCKRLYNQ